MKFLSRTFSRKVANRLVKLSLFMFVLFLKLVSFYLQQTTGLFRVCILRSSKSCQHRYRRYRSPTRLRRRDILKIQDGGRKRAKSSSDLSNLGKEGRFLALIVDNRQGICPLSWFYPKQSCFLASFKQFLGHFCFWILKYLHEFSYASRPLQTALPGKQRLNRRRR